MSYDDTTPTPTRRYLLVYVLAALAVVLVLVSLYWSGAKTSRVNSGNTAATTEDPRAQALDALTRTTDLDTCRQALAQFDIYLARHPDKKPAALTPQQR